MKSLLTLLAMLFAVNFSYAQWTTSSGNTTTMDNVGIGMTAPNGKLNIFDSTAGNSLLVLSRATNSAVKALDVTLDASDNTIFTTANSDLNFKTNFNGGSTLSTMYLNYQGNVGIGTTSPISGGAAASWLTINGTSTYSGGVVYSVSGTAKGYSFLDGDGFLTQQAMTSSGQKFVVNSTTTAMTMLSNGNVGIGTTSPGTGLEVSRNSGFGEVMRISNSTANSPFMSFYTNGSRSAYIGHGGNTADFTIQSQTGNIQFSPNNALAMTIATDGNVAIGTTDPKGHKLAVNGDIVATKVTVLPYANWPDYVFKPQYHLPSLAEVKTYIDQNQHLPDMPSEKEVAKDGINLGEIVKLQTKKIEELTLYLIQLKEENKALKKNQEQIKETLNHNHIK